MAQLLQNLKTRYFDANGVPLSGGKLFAFQAGTSTPQDTFTDQSGGTPNLNPVILDANGQADVWVSGLGYKFILQDSNGVVQWTEDNVYEIEPGSITNSKLADDSVSTEKIQEGAVTADEIAAKTVTAAQIADHTLIELNCPVKFGFIPTGAVIGFAGTAAPTGYLLCDGSAVSRTTYANLFSVLGISHGQGDNSTTFNLPDGRGRFMRGVDGVAGNDPDKAARTAMNTGGNTGNNVGSIQVDDMKSHVHSFATFNSSSNGQNPQGTNSITPGGSFNTGDSSSVVSGQETRPRNFYENFIIKT